MGFYPQANLYANINSPLWFITPLIFYYLLFPIIFIKKIPELTALLFYIIGIYLINWNINIDTGVRGLWAIHYLAFPLGILFASILNRLKNNQQINNLIIKLKTNKILFYILYATGLIVLSTFWLYFFKHSGVGQAKMTEQLFSLLALLITTFIFILKPIESKFLIWLGVFSYEIYLLHWPLIYRYDFLFRFLPAGAAMFIYLIFFILLGFLINKLKEKITKKPAH